MRIEWSAVRSVAGGSSPASSWNGRRLVASALVVALSLLGLGVGIAGLLSPDSVAAGNGAAAVLGTVEIAPETESGETSAELAQIKKQLADLQKKLSKL